jgi:peptidyl-prolyl cis-trans isomerase NIMA-interacting 1
MRHPRLALAATLLALCACKDDPPNPAAAAPTASSAHQAPSAPPSAPAAPADAGEAKPAASPAASAQKPPERVIVQHVLISYKGVKRAKPGVTRTKGEAKELAEKVRTMALDPNGDFTELVKKYSDDPAAIERLGSTGWMKHGDMAKPFEEAAFGLRLFEISPVVETPFGYHVIKRNQ